MSTEIIIKMDKADFEALSNTYMAFNKSWDKQIKAGRFTGRYGLCTSAALRQPKTADYIVIYWFDSALALIIAKSYLTTINFPFRDLYDTHLDQYCIITNYEVREGLANAI